MFRSILGRRRAEHIEQRHSVDPAAMTEECGILYDALVAYGMESDKTRIENVQAVYQWALENVGRDERIKLWPKITDLIAPGTINPNPLLAMAICDPDREIAATCALDFVCFSPTHQDGRPFGIWEFVGLFPNSMVLENPGAVFGGLLCLGDQNLASFYRETTQFLTTEQIQVASHCCRGARLFHVVFDYWMGLLETLIEDQHPDSETIVGLAAAALVGMVQAAKDRQVMLATRVYPCTSDLDPVHYRQVWTFEEYAALTGPRLRAIADREPPPLIMSDVLKAWGISGN